MGPRMREDTGGHVFLRVGPSRGERRKGGAGSVREQRGGGRGMTCGWRKGDSHAPRLHGMGPRIREDTGGSLCGDCTRAGWEVGARDDMWVAEGGWVPASARTREGKEFPPPSARGRLCAGTTEVGARDDMWVAEGEWVPASARTTEGEGMGRAASSSRRGFWPPSWRECPGSPPTARWQRSALQRGQRRRV